MSTLDKPFAVSMWIFSKVILKCKAVFNPEYIPQVQQTSHCLQVKWWFRPQPHKARVSVWQP